MANRCLQRAAGGFLVNRCLGEASEAEIKRMIGWRVRALLNRQLRKAPRAEYAKARALYLRSSPVRAAAGLVGGDKIQYKQKARRFEPTRPELNQLAEFTSA